MLKQPFHHGNLRAELLDRAEEVLRERGADKLSLRELARDAGVSHGAPRSHFIDRAALLEALAERGFLRLAEVTEAAAGPHGASAAAGPERLRAAGAAYLAFASENPALLALMVAAKAERAAGPVHDAAARFLATMTALVTEVVGGAVDGPDGIMRLTLLLSATVQGISSMTASGRIPAELGPVLLDEAVRVFVAGTLYGAA